MKWTRQNTHAGGPFPGILGYDIFVNCIFLSKVGKVILVQVNRLHLW